MPAHDDLGTRMKEFYEQVPKTKLMRRTPVIIRIDGKAFHTFTRGFKRPFDEILIKTMQETTKYLCENIQGCVLGYTQSDEITLVLVDYKKLNSAAWFDYEVQKMCSIAASMATMAFNKIFERQATEWIDDYNERWNVSNDDTRYRDVLRNAISKGAMFDARVFNIPKEEVTNCLYWRQVDATRNSIQMLGQAHFSHKELQHKTNNDVQDMLMLQKGINWNDLPTHQKRGSCVIKMYQVAEGSWSSHAEDCLMEGGRTEWEIDTEIPIFKGENRSYIDDLVIFGE